MNVGALIFAAYVVPGKKATNQQQHGERHKKEQLNSLSLCLLLTRRLGGTRKVRIHTKKQRGRGERAE